MSETLLIALFSLFGSWCLVHSKMIWDARQDSKKMYLALELYFKKMEAAALEVLHSPNNHLGLDYYIDQYRRGHNDMSDQDWIDFHAKCERLSTDATVTPEEKLAATQFLAIFSAMVAMHKMSRIPAELRQKVTKHETPSPH